MGFFSGEQTPATTVEVGVCFLYVTTRIKNLKSCLSGTVKEGEDGGDSYFYQIILTKKKRENRHLFFIPTFEYFIEGCLHVVL